MDMPQDGMVGVDIDRVYGRFAAAPVRVVGPTNEYRLAKKPDGSLVLQRCFEWRGGATRGHEWRDQETVVL